ncbi:hypothetical protein NCS57_00274200 [Fusarium keratoplasticum]|uniref:Uncharacterized protein n=1 Tax=Fusarium keratoplasticum TaxID=1328300 RepID=A0ACC0R9I8_9HYPO|nr:hypothetical protein NCS57_00274200 [Fusarium keratoplasticum]KAI8679949.1 hypothetical protein NCS57_00274200 [Fusarium keratoplasticum]
MLDRVGTLRAGSQWEPHDISGLGEQLRYFSTPPQIPRLRRLADPVTTRREDDATVALPLESLTRTSLFGSGIMPPVLHPKSRMTSSLFATTVAACFLVVTMPHLLPCPVPRARFADGEIMVDENGRRMRWKKKDSTPKVEHGIVQFNDVSAEDVQQGKDRVRRECPVPKPGGMLGEWLGFHKGEGEIETRAGR